MTARFPAHPTYLRAIVVACWLLASNFMTAGAMAQGSKWTNYVHPQKRFSLSYPADIFLPSASAAVSDGQLFVSRDGRARLIVGVFTNDGGLEPKAYRDYILRENYAGATLDYAPLRRTWFVISGTLGNSTFYQRVTFVCSGRLINSWALLYPTAEKQLYDRIVERVHRSFVPGIGPSGDCVDEEARQLN